MEKDYFEQRIDLNIFFDDSEFIATKRSERYGSIDFIANFGGLLGLFMGVSILSLVEIFYFFVTRLVHPLLRYTPTVKNVEENAEANGLTSIGKLSEDLRQ